MKLCWCTIKVRNLDESLKFYNEVLGLPIIKRFYSEGSGEIVFLGEGETKIELIFDEKNKSPEIGQNVSLGFEVNSLDDAINLVKKNGFELIEGPFQPSPHVRFFFINDSNGVKIQFVENL